MTHFIQKLRDLAKTVATERGDFVLFALMQRAEGLGLWDLLVSAPWFGEHETEPLAYLVQHIYATLTPAELMVLSRIIPLPPYDPRVHEVCAAVHRAGYPSLHDGDLRLTTWTLAQMSIRDAHILTAMPPLTDRRD